MSGYDKLVAYHCESCTIQTTESGVLIDLSKGLCKVKNSKKRDKYGSAAHSELCVCGKTRSKIVLFQ